MTTHISSFLGANTPQGFVSFFDELYNPYKNCRMYIIKGGPGTGKSTLMKKLYEKCKENYVSTERVFCSSDPKSLDGLIISDLKVAIADGTSPHVIEPKFPGATENLVNTGEFWNSEELYKQSDTIRSLTLENSLLHRRSAKYLAAAGSVNSESLRVTSKYIDMEKLRSFAFRFCKREMPPKKNSQPGKRYKRFISAITPEGNIFLDETITKLSTRVIGIVDEFSDCSSTLCNLIGDTAIKNGYDCIFCHCPLKPHGECEHIIIPELSLCLMTVKKAHNTQLLCDRMIHVSRFMYEGAEKHLTLLKFNRKLTSLLVSEAVTHLKSAKAVHDELERIYVEAMDFDALGEYTNKIMDEILRYTN